MITTSHFIGISLQPLYFANIFIEIAKLLWNEVHEIIEFQNPLSPHITLLYLPEDLSKSQITKIKSNIAEINIQKIDCQMAWLDFFGNTIAYIAYQNIQNLTQIHMLLKTSFSEYSNIWENSYPEFIPHTTIFRIKDFQKLQKYIYEIDKIIAKNLEKITFSDIYFGINVYAVNSQFNPELQIIL